MTIWTAVLCALCLSAVAVADGYLFVTFKGESTPMTEQVYFVISDDGKTWEELHGGKPALVSTVGEKGVRDPYLIRKPTGGFVLIATDLSINLTQKDGKHDWGRAANRGSKSIVVWESDDLVKWSGPTLAKVAADDAGCTWAPEATYDEATGDFLVYWASRNASDDFAKFRIWAARTNDFKTFGPPFIYIDRDHPVIDTTIVREAGTYHRFTKDEKHSAIMMDSAPRLDGPWKEVDTFTLAKTTGYEGPECFELSPGQWCLVLDHYTKGEGYKPWTTTNLARGDFRPAADFKFPFRLRHGSILPITAAEMTRLRAAYK
jgi:hypothetical protein